MRAAALLALVLLIAPGCIYRELGPTEVRGEPEGYAPTPSALKMTVRGEDDARVLVVFERRDWYVAEIARRLDQREVGLVAIAAVERNIPGEVLAETFREPGELNELRYDAMGASAEERRLMDLEYDELLEKLGVPAPPATGIDPTTGGNGPALPPLGAP